jgi:hypothetical protein
MHILQQQELQQRQQTRALAIGALRRTLATAAASAADALQQHRQLHGISSMGSRDLRQRNSS